MRISNTTKKRLIISVTVFLIGVVIYMLFNSKLLVKSNIIYTIIKNYFSDGCWSISFFFIAVNFSKNITQKYILLTSVFVFTIGIIFETMQLMCIANGTFDLMDILVYLIAVLISCLIEKKFVEEKYEKI